MFKKVFFIILIVVIAMAMVSCGGKKEEIPEEIEVKEEGRKGEIELIIKEQIADFSKVDIEDITINENMGRDEEGYYIALVKLKFEPKNKIKTANEMMRMYSNRLADALAGENDVDRLVVFWKDVYNDRQLKYGYDIENEKIDLTDIMGE